MDSSKEICPICLGSLTAGQGQALFTAECSHTFHFNCIAANVQHGNHICPTCRATWQHLPLQGSPSRNNPTFPNILIHDTFDQPPTSPPPGSFADDEPLSLVPASTPGPTTSSPQGPGFSSVPRSLVESMNIKASPEYPALSGSDMSDSFAVLVGIRAPPLSPEAMDRPESRAPIDLVAVLDVSGSMSGDKIRLLKQAANFIVDNLGPMDRLSIITFSTYSRRVTPLKLMTDSGKAETAQAVNCIQANGATNIVSGLKMAVQVLEQRRQKNPVSSIILLSDGQDNQNGLNGQSSSFYNALRLLPACIRSRDNENTQNPIESEVFPVHTFGFGCDHDATALHTIADGSGGTFSYIESIEIIQDAFAQCIGGLLSVVAQEVEISLQSGSSGVRIRSIASGRYRNVVDSTQGRHGVVYVRDLYAEEEKQFLVYLLVPEASMTSEEQLSTTRLLEVKCSYKDPLSNQTIVSDTEIVEIRRPTAESLTETDRQICLEVDRERNRIAIAEGIAQAQAMAERGELDSAHSLLNQQRAILLSSPSAQSGDTVSSYLESEVREIQERMSSRYMYQSSGRAFAFSRMSAHMNQRATTQAVRMARQQGAFNNNGPMFGQFGAQSASFFAPANTASPQSMVFETPMMRNFVTKSQLLRQSTAYDDGEDDLSN